MTGLNPYLPREGLREGQPFTPDRILEVSGVLVIFSDLVLTLLSVADCMYRHKLEA